MQMLLYFSLFYKNRQWANQLCSWIIFIQLYISAIIAWYFSSTYSSEKYSTSWHTALCCCGVFSFLCVFSHNTCISVKDTHTHALVPSSSPLTLPLSLWAIVFFCLSASYCFRYFLTCKTFSADTGLQFSVIPLSTMLLVFTIYHTCFLNIFVKHLFIEVWLCS